MSTTAASDHAPSPVTEAAAVRAGGASPASLGSAEATSNRSTPTNGTGVRKSSNRYSNETDTEIQGVTVEGGVATIDTSHQVKPVKQLLPPHHPQSTANPGGSEDKVQASSSSLASIFEPIANSNAPTRQNSVGSELGDQGRMSQENYSVNTSVVSSGNTDYSQNNNRYGALCIVLLKV